MVPDTQQYYTSAIIFITVINKMVVANLKLVPA